MTWLVIGEEYLELSARECLSPLELPQPSRVESGWVVSVGADTSQAVTADTTHNFGPRGRAETNRPLTGDGLKLDGCVCMDAYKGGCVAEVPVPDSAESSRGPNSPPVFSWFAGGAPEPRERLPLSSPPGARRFPFRVG